MKNTIRCYYFFVIISILIAILLAIILYRLNQGFEHPTEDNLYIFLRSCKYHLILGLFFSTSLSVALKCILEDLEWKMAYLRYKVDNMEDGKNIN